MQYVTEVPCQSFQLLESHGLSERCVKMVGTGRFEADIILEEEDLPLEEIKKAGLFIDQFLILV